MPIKLPKGFARRKSSGNVLDEVDNGQETSFRVFERPGGGTRSFEGGMTLKNAAAGRYYNNRPATAESDNLFAGIEKPLPNNRGSGGTHHSTSTAGVYDSSSSARYSSSSTLPSSNDGVAHNDHSKTFHDIPAPPVPVAESPSLFSLRAAGRTFSFGTKAARFSTPSQVQRQQTEPQYQQSESAAHVRDRAMTASSASTATATPPRLLDSDFQLSGTDDDTFGSMFENFGKRKSAIQLRPVDSDDVQSKALPIPPQDERPTPININVDRSQPVEPSPYSANSQTSYDGLMNDSNARLSRKGLAPSQSNRTSNMATSPVSMSSESSGPSTAFIDDADAAIVRQSLLISSSKPKPPTVPNHRHESVDEETPLFTNDDITSSARLASQYEAEVSSRPNVQNKVMTPAQFEHYRKQRELTRKYSNASKSDSSVENDYDEDEDEAEKSREAARQRRKQEAHLSVYRQQMMKVIGEQAPAMSSLQPPPASRLTIDHANPSMPNLSSRMSTLGLPAGRQESSKSSDGEDDEDVPLGILAAHGFPNKLRPPTRLSVSTSNPNLRGSVAPGSVAGESGRDARNSLPVFARNLPPDPYYGAGLVNGPVRESLTFGGGNPGYGPNSSGPMHPGGLVGVIASEERARAMRRGSPNAQAAGIPRPYSTNNMGQMGGAHPGMPPQQPSPGEMAQMQINQQMTEMMQVQVQMMQQMMQMQGQAAQFNPGLMPPVGPFVNPGGRPMSTASSYNMPGQDQRTLSLLDPATMSRWNLNQPTSVQPDAAGPPGTPQGVHVYAPSIAPSERSNVGMASRYRPVSTVGPDPHMVRSSTFTSTLKPWNNENQRPVSLTPPTSSQASNRKSMATVTVRAVSTQGQHSPASKAVPDDDDDDEGWADMKKKREKNKSSWKMRKETSALGDLLHMVH